ncbi:hypothetical protein HII31_02034 [Pseudocercospora fuligena]|uniref:2EXR domain-containing protein n=1 Tax=Pseudocercospora fuligena TaxID=685502 RepID=A0A8H6VQD2_9PEZI|nr:hypothetical protein HII31_02034 [Pseudocercospora fuligena]
MADDVVEAANPANSGKCHLLALPAELRNEIWKLVLPEERTFCICRRTYCNRYICSIDQPYHMPALVGTCRQIQNEAGWLWYTHLDLHYITHGLDDFMKALGAVKALLLRRITREKFAMEWHDAEDLIDCEMCLLWHLHKIRLAPSVLKFPVTLPGADGTSITVFSHNPRADAAPHGIDTSSVEPPRHWGCCNARFQAHINAHMHIHLHEGHTHLSQSARVQEIRDEEVIPEEPLRDQEDCRLLNLPGEIRNRIYEYVLADYTNIALDNISLTRDQTAKHVQFPSIVEICQQIRKEAIGIWLSSTTFHFNFHGELYDFLRVLGVQQAGTIKDARETYVWQNQSQAECSLRQFRKGLDVLGIEMEESAVAVQFLGEKGTMELVRRADMVEES